MSQRISEENQKVIQWLDDSRQSYYVDDYYTNERLKQLSVVIDHKMWLMQPHGGFVNGPPHKKQEVLELMSVFNKIMDNWWILREIREWIK